MPSCASPSLAHVTLFSSRVLTASHTAPRSNTIQVWCHDNPKVGPAFPRLLKTLVGADVLSTGPLVYWYSKGHKAQGAEQLRAKAAPLIKFLQEQEEEESDEESD